MAVQSGKSAHSKNPIRDIGDFLAPELSQIEQILRNLVDSESELIREVGDYIALSTGKKLRPIVTLLCERAFRPTERPSVEIAAALEAIHVATLLHDDVIDRAQVRRGRPSVNARWDDDVAILMADYLYAAAFDLSMKHLSVEPLQLICAITRQMCEGEMYQIERRGQWLTPDDYLHIITRKTAALFSACGAIGGICAALPEKTIDLLSAFGLNFGLAFQITDDALDYTAKDENWGKSIGIDLEGGKQTLPLILALQEASPEDRQQLESVLNNGRDLPLICRTLERYGTIERSLETARGYAKRATEQLADLDVHDPTAFDYLTALPEYVIGRRY